MASNKKLERACERLHENDLFNFIDKQTDLVHFGNAAQFEGAQGSELRAGTNEEVWGWFVDEQLYDTRRLVLEEFHLFEWVPLAPGKFHTPNARLSRVAALEFLQYSPGGETYFDPYGKAMMINGGVGTVRLLPRTIRGEEHYFMTASSTGVCHEGFPVLVPRRFYQPVKRQIVADGYAAATVRGEMRYLPEEVRTLFGSDREVPLLYLHVDEPPQLTRARGEVKKFEVSVAVSFEGEVQGEVGTYATYATFDPTRRGSLQRACEWIEQVYVSERYQGTVLTDFDEARPVFPGQRFSVNVKGQSRPRPEQRAVFSLKDLMSGKLDLRAALPALPPGVIDERRVQIFIRNYKQINTGGGANIEGGVHTGGGKFVGRDSN